MRLRNRKLDIRVGRQVNVIRRCRIPDVEVRPVSPLRGVMPGELREPGVAIVHRGAAAVHQPAAVRLRPEEEEAILVLDPQEEAQVGLRAGDVARQKQHPVRWEVDASGCRTGGGSRA